MVGDVVHANFGAQKVQVPKSLVVRSDGMTTARFAVTGKDVMLDFPPQLIASVVGSLMGFNGSGEIQTNVRTSNPQEEAPRRTPGSVGPLLDSLVGKEATVDGSTGRVGGFHIAGENVLVALEVGDDSERRVKLLPVGSAGITVSMGTDGKTRELAPQKQTVTVVADSELTAVECVVPGNRWGIRYDVHFEGKGTLAVMDTKIIWGNPFDQPFSGKVRFENVRSFSAEPSLDLRAAPLTQRHLGDETIAAPQLERPMPRVAHIAAVSVAPASRRVAGGGYAAGAAAAGYDFDEINALEEMAVGAGLEVSSGAIPKIVFETELEAGPQEKVTIALKGKEKFEGRLLLIADVAGQETTPVECARFKTGDKPLLAGHANVYFDGEHVGSDAIDFTQPGKEVTLSVRAAREVSVLMQNPKDERHVLSTELVRTEDGRVATRTTTSSTKEITYVIDNTGEERELLLGHNRMRNSKIEVTKGADKVDMRRTEETRNFHRLSVKIGKGTTVITVKETVKSPSYDRVGRFANWWHRKDTLQTVPNHVVR